MEKGIFACFLLGAGAGMSIALLVTPKSGREARKVLKRKAAEGTEYMERQGSELRETTSEVVERGKEAIGRQKAILAEAVEAGKQAYRQTIGQSGN